MALMQAASSKRYQTPDALIGDLRVPPVGDGYLRPGDVSGLADILDGYNERRPVRSNLQSLVAYSTTASGGSRAAKIGPELRRGAHVC
jgi:hypothetical protein